MVLLRGCSESVSGRGLGSNSQCPCPWEGPGPHGESHPGLRPLREVGSEHWLRAWQGATCVGRGEQVVHSMPDRQSPGEQHRDYPLPSGQDPVPASSRCFPRQWRDSGKGKEDAGWPLSACPSIFSLRPREGAIAQQNPAQFPRPPWAAGCSFLSPKSSPALQAGRVGGSGWGSRGPCGTARPVSEPERPRGLGACSCWVASESRLLSIWVSCLPETTPLPAGAHISPPWSPGRQGVEQAGMPGWQEQKIQELSAWLLPESSPHWAMGPAAASPDHCWHNFDTWGQ